MSIIRNLLDSQINAQRAQLEGKKYCKNCCYVKDVTEFRMKGKTKNGKFEPHRDNICLSCSAKYVKAYRATWRGRCAQLVKAARTRAIKYNRAFEIDKGWVYERLVAMSFKCELTGVPFDITANKIVPASMTLDRIDSSKGYTKENTRIVAYGVNHALRDFGDEWLTKMLSAFLSVKGYVIQPMCEVG